MPNPIEARISIPLAEEFFCDSNFYVLTSASLGGSNLTPETLSDILGRGEEPEIENLLSAGVCMPLFFDGDCALDGHTLFVLGDLTEPEEHDWIGHLAGQLKVPCGQLVLLCGGGDAGELAKAISGELPEPNYQYFQKIEVPPGDYRVDIYAYLSSMTVQLSLGSYDENWDLQEDEALKQWYAANRPGPPGVGYIIRLSPLDTELPLPRLVPEVGWCGEFECRKPNL